MARGTMTWHGMARAHQWIPIKLFLLGGFQPPQTPWRGACSPPRPLAFREAPPLGLSVDLGTKIFWSHGHLFWTPRKNIFGVMGLFFGPLGQFFMIS